jgi:Flp pilus assembly pilin Flp
MLGLKGRKGQTAIEYLLVTVSLLFVFVMMFKALQYALSNQFKRGGMVIIKMYKQDPW